jgi:hypothetical protein
MVSVAHYDTGQTGAVTTEKLLTPTSVLWSKNPIRIKAKDDAEIGPGDP